MNPADLERLRQGGPGCPSEVTLHRLRAGELPDEKAQALRQHVDGCEACTARMAQQAAGFNAFPEADPVRMLAAIRRAADEKPQGVAQRWQKWLRAVIAPVAVVAAAAGVVLVLQTKEATDGGMTRLKGGPTLHVFHQQNGAVTEALSGERIPPGEALQLTVDLPADSRVRIVGVEASGKLYAIWPQDEATPFAPLKAGHGLRIPGAFTPDDTPGTETFHVIACAPQAPSPACHSQGAKEPLACSAGCQTSAFVVQKGP